MAWALVFFAGLFEIVWAVGLRASDGFSRPRWVVVTVVALIASLSLLALAMRQLPLGTAYAVWVGIGAVGAAVCGLIFFGEVFSAARVCCLLLVVLGVLGLKLTA